VMVPLPTATDNCPGPLFVSSDASPFSPPQPSLFPPGTTTVTFRTCDASCNRATATTTVTVVDTTRPNVTVASPQARNYLHSDVLPISFSASDAGAGLAPGSPAAALDGIAVSNGHSVALLTLALGQHSLVVSAVDRAGNAASHPITFQVIATVGSLITTVNAFVADGRINDSNTANGLLAKLNDARDAMDKGKNSVGANKLREFTDQVNGRAGRSIAPDAAQLLVTDAQYVIGTLQ
jgi:cytochrome c